MNMVFKTFFFASAVLVLSATANGAPVLTTCGQARSDLKVCMTSWHLPAGEDGQDLSLQYASGEPDTVNLNYRQDAEGQGISWYWGSGTVRGGWMELWLRVDYRPTNLPVYPGHPPTAQLFFRTSPNVRWTRFPGTSTFTFRG